MIDFTYNPIIPADYKSPRERTSLRSLSLGGLLFCCPSPHTAGRGASEGKTFAGFSLKMRPIAPNGALQAFCRRQNLGTGGIHFRRARSIPLGWSGGPPRNPKIKDRRWRSFIFDCLPVLFPHPCLSQGRGSVRGEPLPGSPLAFSHPPAGDHFCTAKVPHQQKRDILLDVSFLLVRAMGLEPTRPYGHKHLKLACLPIPARSRTEPTLL